MFTSMSTSLPPPTPARPTLTFTEDLSICTSPPLSPEKNVMILVDRVDTRYTRYTRFAKELHAEIEIALKQSSTVQ
jgi:hypothetical protein